ncbi:MAG: thioesterase [Magnetococcales bacterium]|nr:thioesterase [Magnetococcales bacterium]
MNTTNNIKTLFALPFAGGSVYSYRPLQVLLPKNLNFISLELPGHGQRIREPLLTDLDAMVDDILTQMRPDLDGSPYAIYGHSMGGLLSYLLLHRLGSVGVPLPVHWVVSGARSPSRIHRSRRQATLSREAFFSVLNRLEGLPREVLADRELMNFFEPILRADFQAVDDYQHRARPPLTIPLTVLHGTNDQMVNDAEIAGWATEVTGETEFFRFSGNHFFISTHAIEVARIFEHILILPDHV